MAKFVFAMNVSLDGYVDHDQFAPGPTLFRHWIEQVAVCPHSLYGRKTYDLMRYWEDDQPGWGADEQAFASAWRAQHKWVLSGTLSTVGPNATLISSDFETAIHKLRETLAGDVDVAGTQTAHSLAAMGLLDEYRLYYHPVVLGSGRPMFPGPRPRLRLVSSCQIDEDVMQLIYATT